MLENVNMEEIIVTFINAVDVINPILKNHHRRTSIIAYHIGKEYGFSDKQLAKLVVAGCLHDIGALTVEDSKKLTVLDVENPTPHSVLGEGMLKEYGPFSDISKIIRYHHVHYNEVECMEKLFDKIPIEAFCLHLADRIEILLKNEPLSLNKYKEVIRRIEHLRGVTFYEPMVDAFERIASKEFMWFEVDSLSVSELLERIDMELVDGTGHKDSIEDLVYTLSKIIDYKCSFTAAHSASVAHMSYRLAKLYGLEEKACKEIKVAGYLHDIGKIAIPSEIINKPSSLTEEEFNLVKSHPYYTNYIIGHIKGLEKIALWAGSHHEKLDLSGYPRKPKADDIGIEIELITYADIFTALSEDRPYRQSLPVEEIINMIKVSYVHKIGKEVLPILEEHGQVLYEELKEMQKHIQVDYMKATDETNREVDYID